MVALLDGRLQVTLEPCDAERLTNFVRPLVDSLSYSHAKKRWRLVFGRQTLAEPTRGKLGEVLSRGLDR